jgi:hypothetical protein
MTAFTQLTYAEWLLPGLPSKLAHAQLLSIWVRTAAIWDGSLATSGADPVRQVFGAAHDTAGIRNTTRNTLAANDSAFIRTPSTQTQWP